MDTHSRLIADSVPGDRGHPLQVSRVTLRMVGQLSAISLDAVRDQRGTGGAGLSTRRPRRRVGNSVPKAVCSACELLGSLVHGGGGACDAWPPRWTRRGDGAVRSDRQGCRQAWGLALRSVKDPG